MANLNQHFHPFFLINPFLRSTLFIDVADSTKTNESVDDGNLSSPNPVCVAALPASVVNIKAGHGSTLGVSTNSRILRQKSYSNAVTGTIPSLTVSISTSMSASRGDSLTSTPQRSASFVADGRGSVAATCDTVEEYEP